MAEEPPPDKPIGIVVRRGALRRFDKLKKQSQGLPVTVTWDRRLANRRKSPASVPADRRGPDRRKQPSFTWDLADFVVVAPEDDDKT